MQSLNEIYIYPIKSTQGILLAQALVSEKGLENDRRYMVVDQQGKFITGRTHPQLTQINALACAQKLVLSSKSHPSIELPLADFSKQTVPVQVWADTVQAQHCHPIFDQWLSNFLKQQCQLVYFSKNSVRFIKSSTKPVAFADSHPLLMINQASLDQLNSRLKNPVSALHFRPNLVIKGNFPFVEDTWARIKIGEVEFEVSSPCARCQFVNIDPKTGKADREQPLNTLAQFRYHQGNIDFGQHLIPLNQGIIRCSDEVKVLEAKSPAFYDSMQESLQSNKKPVDIHFAGSDITVSGDNQQLLIDQAEMAGINIPFSCRGGKCGACKVKLLTGEVSSTSDRGLYAKEIQAGYILACSSIPETDISIDY